MVNAIRTWIERIGRPRYPHTHELTITADCGGSNGARFRLWKVELQKVADESGLMLRVLHYPPGASKWNKIEHRMFCHITPNWRGQLLESQMAVVELIGATTTKTGPTVEFALDKRTYENGIQINKSDINRFNIEGDALLPERSYTIKLRCQAPKRLSLNLSNMNIVILLVPSFSRCETNFDRRVIHSLSTVCGGWSCCVLLSREGIGSPTMDLPLVHLRESEEGLAGSQHSEPQSAERTRKNKAPLRVAYISACDPTDRRTWSGTHFRIIASLKPYVGDVVPIGPLDSAWRGPLSIYGKLSRSLWGKRYAHECGPLISASYGRQIEQRMKAQPFDVILAPAASSEISAVRTRIPIVYLSDATFALMRDYYPKFAEMLPSSQRAGDELDRAAISKAARVIYPSQWAARSAIDHYRADPGKVVEIPFGANFDVAPAARVRPAPPAGRCRMLFVGKGWARKGGPLAVEAVRVLRARGVDATLVVVGCAQPAGLDEPGVEFISSIDKRDSAGERHLRQLYEDADLFLLPTRAECFGVVFCEAAGYGLPIVAASTGGVPSAVSHGANGLLLPLEGDARAYADAVESIVTAPGRYVAMAAESRRLYETRLNWDSFGRSCAQVLHAAAAERVMA